MNVLVTGCAGFIGSHLTEALLTEGNSVLGVDCFNANYQRAPKLSNLSAQAKDWDTFEFVPIDLSRGELEELVAACDLIVHLAAEPGVRSSWGTRFERYVQNNLVATQLLLEAAKRWPQKRFVYASSSSVYGDAESFPTPETAVPRPISPYGATKLGAEHLCQLYAKNYGTDVVILRYFTVYGPRQRPDMAFHLFCRAALGGESIVVYGDGHQTRDFTYVNDVVTATLAAARADLPPAAVYNIGGGSQTSVREVIDQLSELTGKVLEPTYVEMGRGDVRHTSADTARAHAALGFAPATSLRDGLAAELAWMHSTMPLASVPTGSSIGCDT